MLRDKIIQSPQLFVSMALNAMLFVVASPVGAQKAKTPSPLRLGIFQKTPQKETESEYAVCRRGYELAFKEFLPQIKIETQFLNYDEGKFLESYIKAVQVTESAEVFILPPDERLLTHLEPVLDRHKVPVIFPASLNPDTNFSALKYLYSLGASPKYLAQKTREYMQQKLAVKKLYVLNESLMDEDLLWVTELADVVKGRSAVRQYKEYRLIGLDKLPEVAEEINKMRPDLVFAAVSSGALTQLMMQLKLKNLKTPLMVRAKTFEGVDTLPVERIGHYVVSDYSSEDTRRQNRDFVANYKKAYEAQIPNREAALCYDAVAWAAKAALGTGVQRNMKAQLDKTRDFAGLMGLRRTSKDGIMRDVYFSQTQESGLRLLEKAELK